MTGPVSIADVLERNRVRVAPNVRADFVAQVAAIEVRNQFDDDRTAARRELRELLRDEAHLMLVEEAEPGDY